MEYEISECIAHYKRIYCLVKLVSFVPVYWGCNVKCIPSVRSLSRKFKKHFLDIEMYTSCWLLYSEQIYSPTIAIILQWGLMESIPTFPPLPSSATSSICYNSKQILSTLLSSHGNLLPALKAQGSSHTYQVIPNSCWPQPAALPATSSPSPSVSVLPPVLFSGGNLHLCRAEVLFLASTTLFILQVLPMFHFRLKPPLAQGPWHSPPSYKSTVLTHSPGAPVMGCLGHLLNHCIKIHTPIAQFLWFTSVPCNSSMFLSLTITEYSSMVHTAVYPRAMNLPNCKIWRKNPHKSSQFRHQPQVWVSWWYLPSVELTTYLESLHKHTRFNNLLEQFTELRESAIFRITISL